MEAYAARDIRVQLSNSPTLKTHLLRAVFRYPFKDKVLVTVDLKITGKNVLDSVRDDISNELSKSIYIFDNEYEQLITHNPDLIQPDSGLIMLQSFSTKN